MTLSCPIYREFVSLEPTRGGSREYKLTRKELVIPLFSDPAATVHARMGAGRRRGGGLPKLICHPLVRQGTTPTRSQATCQKQESIKTPFRFKEPTLGKD